MFIKYKHVLSFDSLYPENKNDRNKCMKHKCDAIHLPQKYGAHFPALKFIGGKSVVTIDATD